VRAIRFSSLTIWILLLCLALPQASADDSTGTPPPAAKAASPARPRQARPKSYPSPPSSRPANTSGRAGSASSPSSASSNRGQPPEAEQASYQSVGDVTPEDVFPAEAPLPETVGINPLTLPIQMEMETACPDDEDHPMAPATGMTLTSGRWFNRGCWYTKQDVIYLERSERGRHKRILATEYDPTIATTLNQYGTTTAGYQPSQLTSVITVASPLTYSLPFGSTGNYLPINASLGFSPGARLTIGANLGTDAMNRDSAIEFTFQGLNHWSQQGSISAYQPNQNTLDTNFVALPLSPQIPNSAPGFTGSNFQSYVYNGSLNSYELNFRVTRRMGRDRTVLTREGIWARVATPQVLPGFYGGLRLITYNESFLWNSVGTDPSTIAGTYAIRTHNDLFGPQFGGTVAYQHEHWRFSGRLAGGALVAFADQNSIVGGYNLVNGTSINATSSNSNTTLALMLDFGLNCIYQFRPNMGLRVGYQIMALSNLALAERQITFLSLNPGIINQDHGLYFQGISAGLEFAW